MIEACFDASGSEIIRTDASKLSRRRDTI